MAKPGQNPDNLRKVGLTFGGLVAAVAAVASYTHMYQLANSHTQQNLHQGNLSYLNMLVPYLLPLSVDGLLVVASITILYAKRRNVDAPVWSYISVYTGIAISLSANYAAAAGGDIIAKLLNILAPIALALTWELILWVLYGIPNSTPNPAQRRHPQTAATSAVPSPAPVAATKPAPATPEKTVQQPPREAKPAAPVVAGASPLHAVPDIRPDWLTPELADNAKDAMFAYLDRHPSATGAQLDKFGGAYLDTKPSYGRRVRSQWIATKEDQKEAIGE
jgi:hypothetical protein